MIKAKSVELDCAVVIMALISSLITLKVTDSYNSSLQRAAQTEIQGLDQAVQLYDLDHGRYPRSLAELTDPSRTRPDGYLENELPPDPWRKEYVYVNAGEGRPLIISYGRDGAERGDGPDTDLDNRVNFRRRRAALR